MYNSILHDDSGVLTFEWILIITVLVIGVIAGLASVRDAISAELADIAQAMGSVDQSYTYSGVKTEISQGVGAQTQTFFDAAWVEGSMFNDGIVNVEIEALPAGHDGEYVDDEEIVDKGDGD